MQILEHVWGCDCAKTTTSNDKTRTSDRNCCREGLHRQLVSANPAKGYAKEWQVLPKLQRTKHDYLHRHLPLQNLHSFNKGVLRMCCAV